MQEKEKTVEPDTTPIDIMDLVPESAEITLTVENKEREFTLRPFALSDRVWVNRKYGDGIEQIFAQFKMVEICQIVYHQLEEKDKELFAAQDHDYLNDEGEKATERLTGPEVLMTCVSGGVPHEVRILTALNKCLGVNSSVLDKISNKSLTNKKKVKTKKKPRKKKR